MRLGGLSISPSIRADPHPGPEPVILGGGNLIARYLLNRLSAEGRGALAVARRPVDVPDSSEFLHLDAREAGSWTTPPGRPVVSILPLAVLVGMLPHLEAAAAIVAIGSTSMLSKADSLDLHDRTIAERLADAEATLAAWCCLRGIPYTILRPTLVYDGIEDRNVARMARIIRRYRVLPIAWPARGLRQPIHADDVAKAILRCLGNGAAANQVFNIAGGEILTYRAMAERVFASERRRPVFLPLPLSWLESGFRFAVARSLLRQDGVGVSVFRRMNDDLVFDVAPGLKALDYAPRRFVLPKRG